MLRSKFCWKQCSLLCWCLHRTIIGIRSRLIEIPKIFHYNRNNWLSASTVPSRMWCVWMWQFLFVLDDDIRRRARTRICHHTSPHNNCECFRIHTQRQRQYCRIFSLSHRFAAADQHRLPRVSIILLHQFGAQRNATQQIYTHTPLHRRCCCCCSIARAHIGAYGTHTYTWLLGYTI